MASTAATPGPDHIYQAENIEKHDVETENDINPPVIKGICVLSDGNTVISDCWNNKLKLLDSSYKVIDEYDLLFPQGLCYITGCEVAVSVWDFEESRGEIQIINVVRGSITWNKTIKLDHSCTGIAYYNGQLFIGGDYDGLYVFNMDGNNTRRLYEDYVCDVTVNHKDRAIYLGGDGLVMLNFVGTILSRFRDKELRDSTGVAIASNGTVFVAGYYFNNVIQMDKEGRKKMGTLVDSKDGVDWSLSLCVNYQTNELIVGQKGGILVIKLK